MQFCIVERKQINKIYFTNGIFFKYICLSVMDLLLYIKKTYYPLLKIFIFIILYQFTNSYIICGVDSDKDSSSVIRCSRGFIITYW